MSDSYGRFPAPRPCLPDDVINSSERLGSLATELAEKFLSHLKDNLEKELRPIAEAQLMEQIGLEEDAPATG